jgi:hypothetical protein
MGVYGKFIGVVSLAVALTAGAAGAATVPVGEKCGSGNGAKYISLTQGGPTIADALSATMCEGGNSTGGKNSPIVKAGWTLGAEVQGKSEDAAEPGDGKLGLTVDLSTGFWSILNPNGYKSIGISIKQGNGFAFYVLNVTKALSGYFYTGNDPSPTGHGLSHANAWYKGDPTPPSEVPLPAAGWLMLAGIGGLAALRRRKA